MKKLAVAVAAATGIAMLALSAPAYAHVTVSGPGATQGGYANLTFNVPTESDTASTVKLVVNIPTDTPIASVSVQPKPGWTWATQTAKLATPLTDDDGNQVTEAVSAITWTATAGGIKPGEFDTFTISAGPLPKVDTLAFAAIQTYSDGSVVSWNETAAPGSTAEPDHPKPSLTLSPVAASDGAASTASPAATDGAQSTANTQSTSSSSNGVNVPTLVLAIVALVAGLAGLGTAMVARAKRNQAGA